MPDRPPEDDRPSLLARWSLLMQLGQVAHLSYLLVVFAIAQAVYGIPESCWPYVAALLSLQMGFLVFLDYRDWVRYKVQQEASRLDPSLSVSSVLLLSSPQLQDQYHRWMDKTPAVKWSPYVALFFYFCAFLKILSKNGDGCKAAALIMPLPTIILQLVRVAMEIGGAPKQFQSIASLVAIACLSIGVTGLVAWNNPCMISLGPHWISPAGTAMFAALTTAAQLATTPCTMQHLVAACVITGPGDFLPFFMHSQKRHGGLGLVSYPTHYVELGIIVVAAKTAALLVGAAVRYRLANENMTAFLRSVRPRRH